MPYEHDPETCPNHPPASTLESIWCIYCGANKNCDLGDPADGGIEFGPETPECQRVHTLIAKQEKKGSWNPIEFIKSLFGKN